MQVTALEVFEHSWLANRSLLLPLCCPALSAHTVYLDDCNFHECANLESFDIDRTISLVRGLLGGSIMLAG